MQELRTFDDPQKKQSCTLVATSTETAGAYSHLRVTLGPGGGAELHYHRLRQEEFEILEGELEVTVGDVVHRLGPGDRCVAPAGELHGFSNPGQREAVFEVKITPGHTGFENVMRIGAGLAQDGLVSPRGIPKSFYVMSLMAQWSETQLPGVLWKVLHPLFRWGARRAAVRGIDRELVERYGGELEHAAPG